MGQASGHSKQKHHHPAAELETPPKSKELLLGRSRAVSHSGVATERGDLVEIVSSLCSHRNQRKQELGKRLHLTRRKSCFCLGFQIDDYLTAV